MAGRAPNPQDPLKNTRLPLSPFNLWILADFAGFTGADRVMAAAVSTAETTDGNAHAININTNGTADYGSWQINSVHAELFNQFDWANAADNARMAHVVWQQAGGKWTPWTTYPNAANLQVNKVVADIKSNGIGDPNTSAIPSNIIPSQIAQFEQGIVDSIPGAQQLSDVSTFLHKLTDIHSWISIGLMVLGVIIIIVVAVKMLGQDAIKGATKVINSPVGKVVKTVIP